MCFEEFYDFVIEGLYGAVIVPFVIAEIDVEVYSPVFGPGVKGQVTFAEADDGGEARGGEVVVDLAEFGEVVVGDPAVEGGFQGVVGTQEGLVACG